MKFIVIILALVAVPVLFGLLQSGHYKKKLQPGLKDEALGILSDAKIANPTLEFDYLDATVGGFAATEEDRNAVMKKIDDQGKRAVRAFGYDGLKTYGNLDLDKKDAGVTVTGNLNEGSWAQLSSALNPKGLELSQNVEYKEKAFFQNPAFAGISADAASWVNDFLSLPGDRGLEVSASDNIIKLRGDMTESMRQKLVSAVPQGLSVDPSGLNIVAPSPATLNTKLMPEGVIASGVVPNLFNVNQLGFVNSNNVKHDAFTEIVEKANSGGFAKWHKNYYAETNANRGYRIVSPDIFLTGFATPFQKSSWLQKLKGFGLSPNTDELQIFPSSFHYPSYTRESNISDDDLKKLSEAFALNQVFFDTGSSEVVGQEVFKVDSLAATINSVDAGINFIIGGHADATGNAAVNQELSKNRAAAVVQALSERGVSKDRFTVSSFGASEAKKSGSSAGDRRVEILVK